MSVNQISDETIAGYLLGKTNKEEDELIDEEVGDPEFFERVTSVEDYLIDGYVRGRLIQADRELFEQRLMRTARQRERLRIAKAFFDVVDEFNEEKARERVDLSRRTLSSTDSPRSLWQTLLDFIRIPKPALGYAMAAATLLMFVGGLMAIRESFRLRSQGGDPSELARLRQQEEELRRKNDNQQDEIRKAQEQLKETDEKLIHKTARTGELEKQNKDLQERLRDISQMKMQDSGGFIASSKRMILAQPRGGSVERGIINEPFVIDNKSDLAVLKAQMRGYSYDGYRVELSSEANPQQIIPSQLRIEQTGEFKTLVISFLPGQLSQGRYLLRVFGQDNGKETLIQEISLPVEK